MSPCWLCGAFWAADPDIAKTLKISAPYDMHIDIRQLRYFMAVADSGHITRAAETLGMQQPPLSQQIRAIEAEVGAALFTRHPKGVELTEAGRLLQQEAGRLLAEFAAMQERMQDFVHGRRGRIAVGFTTSASAHAFTPAALRLCRSRHPHLQIAVSENNAAEITRGVLDARLSCGFLRVPVARPPGLAFEELLQEDSVLAVPSDHRLAAGDPSRPVPLKALQGERLILVRRPGAPGLYANLLAACARARVTVEPAIEVEHMMTNLNLVAAGAGVSIVPSSMRGIHAQAVAYRPLQDAARLRSPLTLVFREGDCDGPTGTFLALVREAAAECPG
jgi:DNA-binding transcriptional LysR family regulator